MTYNFIVGLEKRNPPRQEEWNMGNTQLAIYRTLTVSSEYETLLNQLFSINKDRCFGQRAGCKKTDCLQKNWV